MKRLRLASVGLVILVALTGCSSSSSTPPTAQELSAGVNSTLWMAWSSGFDAQAISTLIERGTSAAEAESYLEAAAGYGAAADALAAVGESPDGGTTSDLYHAAGRSFKKAEAAYSRDDPDAGATAAAKGKKQLKAAKASADRGATSG